MTTATATREPGRMLAERLGLTLPRVESGNLAGPCLYPGCGSSDAFRLDIETGVGHCFSCGGKSSPYALAETKLGKDGAIALMVELGIFEPSFNGNGNGKTDYIDLIGAVAAEKHCPREALITYGAVAEKGCVQIPMWGPDGKPLGDYAKATNNGTTCGVFRIWPGAKGDMAKGMCEKGKRAGMFFPGRLPEPGETWIIVEGVKDASALTGMGYLAAGMHGNTMNEEYAARFAEVHCILCPDGDTASHDGATKNTKALQEHAASIKLATLPVPIKESHGADVRDVIAQQGADAVRRAIDEGKPAVRTELPPIAPGTRVRALDRHNFGEVVSDNGSSCTVHFVSPEGQTADVELPKSQLVTADGRRLDGTTIIVKPVPAGEMLDKYPRLRPPVIDGVARQGETVNIVSVSKVGKSWLGYSLLLSIVTGRLWLDKLTCRQGRALLIDNELHRETIARRLAATAEAMCIPEAEWRDALDIISLRGQLIDLPGLSDTIHAIDRDKYQLVLADAFYRFLPTGVDENSNAQMAQLYNLIDQYADHLGSVWTNIMHASKGDQSGKAITDVGAGAGSQSRAADCHLILRPHEQDGVVVMEAVVRSFPPVEPVALRWQYPLWVPAQDVDPRRLRQPISGRQKQQGAADEEGFTLLTSALRQYGVGTLTGLMRWTGLSRERCQRLLNKLEAGGQLTRADAVVAGNRCAEYRLANPNNGEQSPSNPQQFLDFENTNKAGGER